MALPYNIIFISLQSNWKTLGNRLRSIYQYSNMAPRLSGQNCKLFKFLLSLNSQKRLEYKENNTKYRSLTRKPRNHVRILIYRTWPIRTSLPSPVLSTSQWRWFGQEMPALQTTILLQSPYYISSLLSLWNIYCIRPHIINTKLKMSSLVCGGYINFVVLPLCELPRS